MAKQTAEKEIRPRVSPIEFRLVKSVRKFMGLGLGFRMQLVDRDGNLMTDLALDEEIAS